MARRIWITIVVVSLLVAAIPVSNAESNSKSFVGVEPYNGLFGADSLFYGLKLFVQHFDVSLEGNDSAKLQKQIAIGRQRLSEAAAVAARNNTGALDAALAAYADELEAINTTLDSENIDDLTYLNASDELQDQEAILADMTNATGLPTAVTDLYNRTLNATREIKNGRPFILCNNTSYFIPPGQIKKIIQGNPGKTPPGLAKKGYVSPEPILVNGTILWPWDDSYSLYTNSTINATGHAGNITYVSALKEKHSKDKSNNNGNGKGNGNGKK
jgi:hypothetical protein